MTQRVKPAYRIVTNIPLVASQDQFEGDTITGLSLRELPNFVMSLRSCDALVTKLPTKELALACALARIIHPKLVVAHYDVVIPVPDTAFSRAKRRIWLEMVRQCDLILTVHKDVDEYASLLRLKPSHFRYIGFKSNAWENNEAVSRGARSVDEGDFVLACGRSYRDFTTFAQAMRICQLPGVILKTKGDLATWGSRKIPSDLPDNVRVEQHDGTRESWLETILRARIVVVPMRGDVISPATSVPLEAMNLSRPIITTAGPATSGMLDDTIAGIVPPEDPNALAQEIIRTWSNDDLRHARIENARKYVRPLAGEDRIARDIARVINDILSTK